MKALVYEGPQVIVMKELEKPAPIPGDVLIKVESVGICGSELEGYMGHSSIRVPPLVMGHEFCGVVAAIGDGVSSGGENGLSVGDKVVVNPLLSCGVCDRCVAGQSNVCRSRKIVGIHRPGAFADFVSVPGSNIVRVPDGMDANVASLAEPLAVSVHAVKLGVRPLEDVVIMGAGPIGLLTLQAARHMGVGRVLLCDRQQVRLEHAAKLGAEVSTPDRLVERTKELFGPRGVNTIIDCVGVGATRDQAMNLVNPGGTIVMVGLGQDHSTLPVNHLVRQELSLVGSYTYSSADFEQAVQLLVQGKIQTEGWASRRGLEEGPASFAELVEGKSPYSKIFLQP